MTNQVEVKGNPSNNKKDELPHSFTIQNNHLSFIMDVTPDEGALYAFYVQRDGKRIHVQPYSGNPSLTWELREPGWYNIVYFLKKNDVTDIHNSNYLAYFPAAAHVSGPEQLKGYCVESAITPVDTQENREFALLDPIDLASKWEERVFLTDIPDEEAVSALRKEWAGILDDQKGKPVYVLQWNLWESGAEARHLFWILEELYHVCRSSAWDMVELLSPISAHEPHTGASTSFCCELYGAHQKELKERLQGVLQRQQFRGLDDAHIIVEQREDLLCVHFEYPDMRPDDCFAFYLYLDGQVYQRFSWGEKPSAEWKLTKDGIYSVQGFIKRGNETFIRRTLGAAWFGNSAKDQFNRFLEDDTVGQDIALSQALPFVPESAPFCNIVLISEKGKGPEMLSGSFPVPFLAASKVGDWNTAFYSNGQLLNCANGGKALFSGRIYCNHKLYFGAEAEQVLENGWDLADRQGHYSYVTWNSERLVAGADFFGFSRWFYYQSETLFIMSNSYYPLLLALKERNIHLDLDVEKACVTLSSVRLQLLTQNFCRSMDLKGVCQLTADQQLLLDANGWSFSDSGYGRLMKEDIVYHEEDYRKQLAEAKTDLIEILSDILKDQRFEKITLDLTGGLDSRLIYSTLTNLFFDRERVKINTFPMEGSRDMELSTRINSLYHYSYNDFPQTYEPLSVSEGDIRYRNTCLGTYYSHNPLTIMPMDRNQCGITGACGEVVARPYVGRKYLNTYLERQTDCLQFAQSLYEDYAPNFVIGADVLRPLFVRYFGCELSELPGEKPIQMLESLYYTFRHAYHFDVIEHVACETKLKPLQSVKMMRLLKMSYLAHQSIRLQLDMLYQLNPAVAAIPFDSEADNTDREKLRPELVMDSPCWRDMELLPEYEAEQAAWNEAEVRRKARITYLSSHPSQDIPTQQLLYLGLLKNFRTVMNACPELRDKIGVPLYAHFQTIQSQYRQISYWYNKVTSLMDQLAVFCPIVSRPPDLLDSAPVQQRENAQPATAPIHGARTNKPSISIYGSCVSRDILAIANDTKFDLKAYIARQSVISAVAPKIPDGKIALQNPSSFQMRAVECDLHKDTFDILKANKSDYLLLDMIDERFPLLSLFGSYITASNEFFESTPDEYCPANKSRKRFSLLSLLGLYISTSEKCPPVKKLDKHVKDGKLYLGNRCVEDAVKEFCSRLSEIYRPEQIILHYATLVDQYRTKSGQVKSFPFYQINANHRINEVLETIYSRIQSYLPGVHVIREVDGMVADEGHKWGLAPMHYEKGYYVQVLNKIYEYAAAVPAPASMANSVSQPDSGTKKSTFSEREQRIPGKWDLNYILDENDGADWLFVTFSAFSAITAENKKPYSFMNTIHGIRCHTLYLQDSLGERGTYYMVYNMDFSPADQILDWIETVRNNLNISKDHVVLMGASKGGSASLYFGLRGHYGHVLAMAPQIRIGTYIQDVADTADYMLDPAHKEESVSVLDHIIYQLEGANQDTVIHLYFSENDGQFKLHTGPFVHHLKESRLPDKTDICIDNRIKSHTDHLRFNSHYTVKKLLEIMFGIHLDEEENKIQILGTDRQKTKDYDLVLHIETLSGTQYSSPVKQFPYVVNLDDVKRIVFDIQKQGKTCFIKQIYSCIGNLVTIECGFQGDMVTVTMIPKKETADALSYALYLNKPDGSRLQTFSYQKSPIFTFPVDLSQKKYTLQCFWKYEDERYSVSIPLRCPDASQTTENP